MNDLTTAEEMRRQLQLLKLKLENERLVTRRHLLSATKRRLDRIDRRYRLTILAAAAASVYCAAALRLLGVGWWFCTLTSFYMLVALGYTVYLRRVMRRAQATDISLRQKFDRIVCAKRLDMRWLYFSLPLLALWWYGFMRAVAPLAGAHGFLGGAVAGGIAGGCIGIRKVVLTHRNYREALAELDALMQGEDDAEPEEMR